MAVGLGGRPQSGAVRRDSCSWSMVLGMKGLDWSSGEQAWGGGELVTTEMAALRGAEGELT